MMAIFDIVGEDFFLHQERLSLKMGELGFMPFKLFLLNFREYSL